MKRKRLGLSCIPLGLALAGIYACSGDVPATEGEATATRSEAALTRSDTAGAQWWKPYETKSGKSVKLPILIDTSKCTSAQSRRAAYLAQLSRAMGFMDPRKWDYILAHNTMLDPAFLKKINVRWTSEFDANAKRAHGLTVYSSKLSTDKNGAVQVILPLDGQELNILGNPIGGHGGHAVDGDKDIGWFFTHSWNNLTTEAHEINGTRYSEEVYSAKVDEATGLLTPPDSGKSMNHPNAYNVARRALMVLFEEILHAVQFNEKNGIVFGNPDLTACLVDKIGYDPSKPKDPAWVDANARFFPADKPVLIEYDVPATLSLPFKGKPGKGCGECAVVPMDDPWEIDAVHYDRKNALPALDVACGGKIIKGATWYESSAPLPPPAPDDKCNTYFDMKPKDAWKAMLKDANDKLSDVMLTQAQVDHTPTAAPFELVKKKDPDGKGREINAFLPTGFRDASDTVAWRLLCGNRDGTKAIAASFSKRPNPNSFMTKEVERLQVKDSKLVAAKGFSYEDTWNESAATTLSGSCVVDLAALPDTGNPKLVCSNCHSVSEGKVFINKTKKTADQIPQYELWTR